MDKEANTMFYPCMHRCLCKDCFVDAVKKKQDLCPLDRQKIEKTFLLAYDETKKKYMATGLIKQQM